VKGGLMRRIIITLILFGLAGCYTSGAISSFKQKEDLLQMAANQQLEEYLPLLPDGDYCSTEFITSGNGTIIRINKNIKSNFELGDRITSIAGNNVSDRKTRLEVATKFKPGDKVIVVINRRGAKKEIEMTCISTQKSRKMGIEILKAASEGRWKDCRDTAYKYYLEDNKNFGSSVAVHWLNQCNDMTRFNGMAIRPLSSSDAVLIYESAKRGIEEAQYIEGQLNAERGQVTETASYLNKNNFPQLANDLLAFYKKITSSDSSKISKKEWKPSIKKAGSGTCFAINSNGQLVTSYHVVEGSEHIKVRLEDGQVEEAKLLKSSPANDLAVLQIQRKTPNFLPLASAKTTSLGTPVFTMGFPATSILGSDVKFSEGVINSLSGFQNDAIYMQISMPVHPGNSGGPIVTDDGSVVGVVTATAAIATFIKQTGTLPQNVNWGIKADYLIPMVDSLETPNIKANNRQEAIELVRKALCLVTVE